MTEEITTKKESRPMSANNPLRCQNNKKIKYNNPEKIYLSEKEKEQYNKLSQKGSIVDNFLNSPYKNERKNYFIYDNDKIATTKNLLSEIKSTKRKTRLDNILFSANALGNKKKTIKLGTIDANKGINNEKIIINANNNQRNKFEINYGGITNKKSTDKMFIQDNYKGKEKLSNDKKYTFKNKNSKSIEKINITINQKKKNQEEKNKISKKIEEIQNCINNNTNKSINININESINKEKKGINNNKENNNKRNNNYTKNSNDNKTVKFNKEISIINILKESNDSNDTQNNNNNKKEERDNNKDISNNINIENSSIEVKFISNININNQNDIYFFENENNKYNNCEFQMVKNSANSNKNLSEISEEINTNFSKSKLEPTQDISNNNKKESNSDKIYGMIQSISNNIETDNYLHKTINYKDNSIYLGELINEGSRRSIYKGLNLSSGEIICVKRYFDKNDLDEIKSEIELFELIKEKGEQKNSINIIKYYGYKYEDDTNFLFLEYVSVDNLKKIIKLYGGKLNEKLIKIYTKQILKALSFLHNKLKVAHRDIKCTNILLDKNGIIKLIDFGCSGIIEKENKENEKSGNKNNVDKNKPFFGFKGSLPWSAPEVLTNKYYGTKCDIWSLGCSIIEMGGLEPWNGRLTGFYQYIDIVGKSKELPEIPNQFSNELKDFVLQCLIKDPDKRPDSNFLLNHTFIKDG